MPKGATNWKPEVEEFWKQNKIKTTIIQFLVKTTKKTLLLNIIYEKNTEETIDLAEDDVIENNIILKK